MADGIEQPAKKPTCFVIMPISDAPGYEPGHFGRVYEHLLKPAIIAAGYEPKRADDTVKTDYIVVGIIRMIVDSEMVLCDISARNPNVMYELGIRHAFNKPVVLVKDVMTEKMFDIQGLRYTEYNESLRVDNVNKDIARITGAVTETANTPEKDTNSIVHLAGIKAADIPATQTISPDTQVILTALGDIERRVDAMQITKKAAMRIPFVSDGTKVYFSRSATPKGGYGIGTKVYLRGELIGKIESFLEHGRQVVVADDAGGKYLYDVNSEGFSLLDFED
jgi:hypothetical protein